MLALQSRGGPAARTRLFPLHDANPNKPNRWLALPRFHGHESARHTDMTTEQRTAYWAFAIAKAHELWGDGWGLAINSLERRTQCHAHIHIGKLRTESRTNRSPSSTDRRMIPLPSKARALGASRRRQNARPHRRPGAGALARKIEVMLLEITKLPTAENSVIHLHPSDNVAIARVQISDRANSGYRQSGRCVTVDAIPAGHKVALRPSRPERWCCGTARRSGGRSPDRRRAAHPHAQSVVRGVDLRLRVSRPAKSCRRDLGRSRHF